jgi:hypothetical protein
MNASTAALVFGVLTVIVILFQAGLAAGMPWGKASMGGKFPGKYPPKMRVVACVNIIVLLGMSLIVLSAAGLFLPGMQALSKKAVWVVVVFYLAGTVMNTITPSKIERIWAPVALLLFIMSLVVALC